MSEQQRTVAVYLPEGDSRPILVDPYVTNELRTDKEDIIDLIRKRVEKRNIKPIDIRKAGVTKWNAEKHWRLMRGGYSFSVEVVYAVAVAVRLKRTRTLPFAL